MNNLKEVLNFGIIDGLIESNLNARSDHGNFIWSLLILNRVLNGSTAI